MNAEIPKSKVCFVAMDNFNRVPYIQTYIKWIDQPFDVIYWDRSGLNDSIGEANVFRYKLSVDTIKDGSNKIRKMHGYVGFRKFARHILSEMNYDLIFTLTANCAVLLSDVLLSKYSGKYVIDIRDYWHEDFFPYHNREQKLIQRSALAVISSPAYRDFLCEHDYVVMHNDQSIDPETKKRFMAKTEPSVPFLICCIGAMKNPEYDCRVIDYFANDERFELRFIGRGYDSLGAYVHKKGIHNVKLSGAFPMSETMKQYEGADAILNMYGNHSPYWDYALSNKLYFAARLRLPILVCADTAMAEYAKKYNFGYSIDLNDEKQFDKERILRSYAPEILNQRHLGCSAFLEVVEADNDRAMSCVKEICRQGKMK